MIKNLLIKLMYSNSLLYVVIFSEMQLIWSYFSYLCAYCVCKYRGNERHIRLESLIFQEKNVNLNRESNPGLLALQTSGQIIAPSRFKYGNSFKSLSLEVLCVNPPHQRTALAPYVLLRRTTSHFMLGFYDLIMKTKWKKLALLLKF